MKISFNTPKRIYRRAIFTLWSLYVVGLSCLIFFIWAVGADFNNWFGGLPSYQSLENPQEESRFSSELYSADGVLLGKYYRDNRSRVNYEDLGENVRNTLLATEDYRFFRHSGIDLRALFRVLFLTVIGQQDTGGGSTISQQLAKNLFKTRTQRFEGSLSDVPVLGTVIVKVKEWIVAVQLEESYTKKEIMTMYLNTVEFGSNSFGIKVAANTFFNKDPKELEYHEAAVLIGLLQAPTRNSPILNPENAFVRRNTVLSQLTKYDFINPQAYDTLRRQPIQLDYNVDSHNQGRATYFRAVVRDYLLDWCEERGIDLFEDGLKIHTTIDSRLQQYAEDAVAQHMAYLQERFYEHWEGRDPWVTPDGDPFEEYLDIMIPRMPRYKALAAHYGEDNDSLIMAKLNEPHPMKVFSWNGEIDTVMSSIDSLKYHKYFLHAGFMAMEPGTGHIKAWVGGINFRHFKFDHVRYGKRQPGSTFKPFVYTAAIENGYSPCYTVIDAPATYPTGGDPPTWTPKNSNLRYTGREMTIRQGMARSVNSVTAHMIYQVKPSTVIDVCKRMGIKSSLAPVLSLALGVSDVSLYEMVGAYGVFANRGNYVEPTFISHIEDKNGNIYPFVPETYEALSEETAYVMTYMLKGGTEELGGTARGLDRSILEDNEVGAKTGTTQNASDGWFMGVTPNLVAGTWVGGDDIYIHFRDFEYGQGARMAMPIWEDFMLKVYENDSLSYPKSSFARPVGGVNVAMNCANFNTALDSTTVQQDTVTLDDLGDIF